MRSFDDPTESTESASVADSAACDQGVNAAMLQLHSVIGRVGLGPVLFPRSRRESTTSPPPLATGLSVSRPGVSAGGRGAADPRLPLLATRAIAANNSRHSRIPSPASGLSTGCPSEAQRESRSMPIDSQPATDLDTSGVAAWAAAATTPRSPTTHPSGLASRSLVPSGGRILASEDRRIGLFSQFFLFLERCS